MRDVVSRDEFAVYTETRVHILIFCGRNPVTDVLEGPSISNVGI